MAQATSARDGKRKREDGGAAEFNAKAWPFPTDYNDHFSTTDAALKDLASGLDQLATALGKSRSDLVIYDPYYCDGSIVRVSGDGLP